MELKQLTQIQDKISNNRQRRQRTLRKLRNGNSAAGRTITARADSSSNSGESRLLISNVRRSTAVESPEQMLKRIFSQNGWSVREHFNDPSFRVPALAERTVAFTVRNDNNEVLKYSGKLEVFSSKATALFRLAGVDEVFNANLIGFMAVQP